MVTAAMKLKDFTPWKKSYDLKFAADATEQNVFAAQRMLARDLKILFDEKGVEIPFPQVVVHRAE